MYRQCHTVPGRRLGHDRGRKVCDKLREIWSVFETSMRHFGLWASSAPLRQLVSPWGSEEGKEEVRNDADLPLAGT